MSPIIWLLIMVGLLAIEAVTFGLTTIWFAGGALAAAILAFFVPTLIPQLLLFIGVSLVLLVFTRPLAAKALKKDKTPTNIDSLIGREAFVTQEVNNLAQTGKVRINDVDWTARAESAGEIIPENTVVQILQVQGVKLVVTQSKGGAV